ncbi:hypothetical protein [Pseudoalteromonas sp. RB2-MNA-CIBAN-0110]|uniref:hypothetical protein n=1 Tax=Pseudoalteromonas sp. RB2-MNA-CIBAN-0110 TaxID=3140439 RepID=UPI00331AF4B6
MKYLFALVIALGLAGYFGYQSLDNYYESRVSGDVKFYPNLKKFAYTESADGELTVTFKSTSSTKLGWENVWDNSLALATGALVGGTAFILLFFFCGHRLINIELSSKIKSLEAKNEHDLNEYKKQLQNKIEQANSAEETAKSALNDEFAEAERLQDRAQQKLIEAENEKRSTEKLKREAIALVNEAKAKQSEAEDLKSKEEISKLHASQAMQRYKRKVDKLKVDQDELFKFVKKHHPSLIKDDN